jgi:hypothetical protein
MSVMSRTTYEALPRSVTNARQRLEGGGHAWAGVGLAVAEAAAEGDGVFAAVGVPPQADAINAVTASALIQSALVMSAVTVRLGISYE